MPVSRIASALRSVGRDMLNLCYPPLCASCEEPAEGCLCSACEQRLTQLQESAACERCAMPVAMEGSPCPWCEGKGLRPYHRVAVLVTYHDPLL
jgi:predicted amidophosphoribosyltransferase